MNLKLILSLFVILNVASIDLVYAGKLSKITQTMGKNYAKKVITPVRSKLSKTDKLVWSSTKQKSAATNAYDHAMKHRKEFPAKISRSPVAYVNQSHQFVRNPPNGAKKMRTADGGMMIYDKKSNTFAKANKHGIPQTMFKPTDPNYYNKNVVKNIRVITQSKVKQILKSNSVTR